MQLNERGQHSEFRVLNDPNSVASARNLRKPLTNAGGRMRARRIIEGAAFGPQVLKVVSQAFDEAWASIADRFTPAEHEHARAELAEAIMNVARDDSANVARVRDAGIRAIQLKHPSRFASPPQSGQGTKIG